MNRALLGAERKGRQAYRDGLPKVAPYEDRRKPSGRLSWSRAFINAWHNGYDDEARKVEGGQ